MVSKCLKQLFSPTSIAIVGASANPDRFSGKIIPTLLRQGYTGKIYPINPNREFISDLPCYPDLASVPTDVDCVVYALSAQHIDGVLDECIEKNVQLLTILSAGFAETGKPQDAHKQTMVVEKARASGIRVLGPNCIGFANFTDSVCVSSAAVMDWPNISAGRIGLVSQSGGLGLASILYDALEAGVYFSHVITTGNEADLDTIEIASALVDDDSTDAIAMTIEAVSDAKQFTAFLQKAHEAKKPVVILKSGQTELGKTMAASHTGALVGSSDVFHSVCRQYGAICVDDYDDLYEISAMFAKLRKSGKLADMDPVSEGCAAVSLSGGHIGLFADHASLENIEFPPFTPATQESIREALGFDGNFQNPLDTTAQVIGDEGFWGRCTTVLAQADAVKVVVPILTVAKNYESAVRDLIAVSESIDKPVIVIWAGGDFEGNARNLLIKSNIPVFGTPSRAASGINLLNSYCQRQRERKIDSQATGGKELMDFGPINAILKKNASKVLVESDSKEILSLLGIPTTTNKPAVSEQAAVDIAKEINYPVVLKGEHPTLAHKTEFALIKLNLQNETELREAYREIRNNLDKLVPGEGVITVQNMVDIGLELVVGVTHDVEFGPTVMLGLGGVLVEKLNDTAVRVAPFNQDEALKMIEELRCTALLDGYRGMPGVDKMELADILVAVSLLADATRGQIEELDINPLALNLRTKKLCALDALVVKN